MTYARTLICSILIFWSISIKFHSGSSKKPNTPQPTVSILLKDSASEFLDIIDDKPMCLQTQLNHSHTVINYKNIPFSQQEIAASAPAKNYIDTLDDRQSKTQSASTLIQTAGIENSIASLEKLLITKLAKQSYLNNHSLRISWHNNETVIYEHYITYDKIEIPEHNSIKIWIANYPLNKFITFEKQSTSEDLDKLLEKTIRETLNAMPLGLLYVKVNSTFTNK